MRYTEDLQFMLLGPLEVRRGGDLVPVPGRREQAVLGMLLLAGDGSVAVDRLVEAAWDDPPPAAVKAVRNCVSVLRRRLAEASAPPGLIETTATGYRLLAEDCRLDMRQFRQQADAARRLAATGQTAQAATGLRAALSLWRGPALAGVGARILQAGVVALEEQRITALEECLDLELTLGQHDQIIAELQGLAREHPWRERTASQLMLALYRSGRHAEALDTYRQLANRLAGELGIDPGGEVSRLHQAMLRHDPRLDLGPRKSPATRLRPAGRPCSQRRRVTVVHRSTAVKAAWAAGKNRQDKVHGHASRQRPS